MGKKTSKIALIAALSTLWPTFASSQQGGAGAPVGGLQIDIGVNTSLKSDSNFSLTPGTSKGSSQISDTKLSFGVTSVTSAYSLKVVATGDLRFAEIPGRSVAGLEDPTLKVNFVADSANSRLTLDGRYRNVDREFLSPFQVEREEQQFGSLVGDGGTLRSSALGLKYETGLNDPVSFIFDLKHDRKDFSGVVNPAIFDNRTDSAGVTALMRVSPVTTLRLNAGLKDYSANDFLQTNRRTIDYSVGVTQDINPALQLDAQIGFTDVNTDTLFGTAQRSGLVGSVSLTQTLPNGTVFGTLASSRNQNGERVTLSFGRDLQLQNGSLRASLGLTKGSTGSSRATAALAYNRQIANSSFSVSLDRKASTNNQNQDILDTRIGIGYGRTINSISRLNLSLDWGRSEDAGSTGAPTINRTDLTASYSRDLTADWSMTGGVTWRKKTETGIADADSTALFLTLGRNFSFRP